MRIGSNGALSGLSWVFCQFYVLLGPLPSIYHWIEAMKQDSFSKKPPHPKLGPNPFLQISSNRVCFSAQPRPSTPSCSTNLVCFSAPRLLVAAALLVAPPLLVAAALLVGAIRCVSLHHARHDRRSWCSLQKPSLASCLFQSNLIPLHTTHIFIDHIKEGVCCTDVLSAEVLDS